MDNTPEVMTGIGIGIGFCISSLVSLVIKLVDLGVECLEDRLILKKAAAAASDKEDEGRKVQPHGD